MLRVLYMSQETQKEMENLREYYEILRSRQKQIIQIIKETSGLLSRMEQHTRMTSGAVAGTTDRNIDQGMRLAFGMINTLANLLDEQLKALNYWERVLVTEPARTESAFNFEPKPRDYYDINSN